MTSPFSFNPDEVSATIEVLPKDEYEVIVGEPKSFIRAKSDGSGDSIGIRYPLTVAEGPHKGKKIFYTCYLQSEGARSIAKQFLIAASGFKRDKAGEQEFNESVRGADWNYDPTTGAVGDAWMHVKGARVLVSVDVRLGDNGTQQQDFKPGAFSPLN